MKCDRPGGWLTRLRVALGLVCVFGIVGCSSLTARVAGWYLTREVDSYLDLTSTQRTDVRARVDRLLDEARRVELPRWLNLFRGARDAVESGATEAKLATLQRRWDGLMDDAVDKLTPPIAQVLATLSDDQIDYFEVRMREQLDETYEEQALDPAERREALDEKLIEGLEDLVGDVRDDQAATILRTVHGLPEDRGAQYRVGKERIRQGAAFLRERRGAEAIEAELRRLWDTRYTALGPGREKPRRRAEQLQVLLVIDGTLSDAQRDHAVEELNDAIRKGQRFVLPQ